MLQGANVYGMALSPPSGPSHFQLLDIDKEIDSRIHDIRDRSYVCKYIEEIKPQYVFHLAAQSLVPRSYDTPCTTWETNVMGTMNVLEAIRKVESVLGCIVVTSDKVYQNNGRTVPFTEDHPLGGDDPYSSSKAATEILVSSWRKSFHASATSVVTARAGNIIGGGDWAEKRLVPDIVSAMTTGEQLTLRYPNATRPWQHVLDAVAGYILYVEKLSENPSVATALNFGPTGHESVTVLRFVKHLINSFKTDISWNVDEPNEKLEKTSLQLDARLAFNELGWRPKLSLEETVQWTGDWYARWLDGENVKELTDSQLIHYWNLSH